MKKKIEQAESLNLSGSLETRHTFIQQFDTFITTTT